MPVHVYSVMALEVVTEGIASVAIMG